jgi:hypothetical protein
VLFVLLNIAEDDFGRWGRAGPEMTSPFDSLTPICYRMVVGMFRLSATVQKLFSFFDLSMRPQKAPPWVNPRIMQYMVKKNRLSRLTHARDERKKWTKILPKTYYMPAR